MPTPLMPETARPAFPVEESIQQNRHNTPSHPRRTQAFLAVLAPTCAAAESFALGLVGALAGAFAAVFAATLAGCFAGALGLTTVVFPVAFFDELEADWLSLSRSSVKKPIVRCNSFSNFSSPSLRWVFLTTLRTRPTSA